MIERRILATLATLALIVPAAFAAATDDAEYDVVIRGGTLYTGGLEMAGTGDVALRGDRIVAVGEAPGRSRREIDARGKIVAPGFIDLHNHTDAFFGALDWMPPLPGARSNRNYLTQGVTTIVTGNCGTGPDTPDEVRAWLDAVDAMPFGTNVVHLVPHGSLRSTVLGGRQAERTDPKPSAAEMATMKELLDGSLRAGAWGMSSGLEYDPGARATTEELIDLDRVVARHGGVYTSHTRHEGPDPAKMMASYAEAIEVGERAGTPVEISHIKLSGPGVHGMAQQVIELVEAARARGVRVYADQYPYAASSTGLSQVVPVEMRDGMSVLPRFCNEPGRPQLRAAVTRTMQTEMPAEAILVSTYPWKWWLQGETVAAIAKDRAEDPVDVAMDLACGWPGFGIYAVMNEADVRAFMERDWVSTASDGLVAPWPFDGFVHPRNFGTFPRKLRRYALDEAVVSLPFALRSMTSLPAEAFGLPQRGRLEVGYFADLVVFDPDRLADHATYDRPNASSTGVEVVIVNGVVSIEGGVPGRATGGRAIRRESAVDPTRASPP